MSASHPVHAVTIGATYPTRDPAVPRCSDDQHPRRKASSALATSVISTLEGSGKWADWQAIEPRLAGFANLEEAREGWRRRDERCYRGRGRPDHPWGRAAVVTMTTPPSPWSCCSRRA
ncbi:hypothetical protein [Nocardioides sp. B-3]|uniref:hypothetical protein n=1 Tax=Nocardioides sp. B-3 TaxID=2895565 RepID=UPI0021521890|nr:hypothetical protein [Nocardioides sp. B-3]UUZ59569.1 hypothetical protein LP418_28050 [Nocardioides sp. B-3]